MEIKVVRVNAKVQNKRERALVSIVNDEFDRMVGYWTEDPEWEKSFTTDNINHWMIRNLDGIFSAMFFMDMIKEPVTSVEIYEKLKKEVDEMRREAA